MTTSCSGTKCRCSRFRPGGRKPETCGGCNHHRSWHYNSESGDDPSSDGDGDDDSDDNTGRRTPRPSRPSTSTKNEMIVSSLAANLFKDGEYSGVDVDVAKREANAGLTKQRYGTKQNTGGVPTPQQDVAIPLPPIVSGAKVLKIVLFPNGKESLTMDPPVQFPHLTKTHELEAQGLVVFIPSGIHFCKNWSSVTMYSFLERYLPRPFQYFKEQGFSGPTPSRPRNLPFCILERRAGRFSVVKHPENGPTGKFYQDNATGTKGSSFKNRNLVLISKEPIPWHILNEWKRNPLPIGMGTDNMEVDDEVSQQMHGSSGVRPKPRKVHVKSIGTNDPPLDDNPEPRGSGVGGKTWRRTVESDGGSGDLPVKSRQQLKQNKGKSPVARPSKRKIIEISDGGDESPQGGTETEDEPHSSHIAKRQRVRGPGPNRVDKGKGVDLTASVSSLCLEDTPSSTGATPSATILGSWSVMRKASAPFVVGGDLPDSSFEF